MHEIESVEDVKHLLHDSENKEGYTRAFLAHCHLTESDLLYVDWGSEVEKEESKIVTNNGVRISSPPYFLVRHEKTKSLVLCIRGSWNVKDYITDMKCSTVPWEFGSAHEGIALIADSMYRDELLNRSIVEAFRDHPDYRLVAVGHSLGAGIASLLTIRWRTTHLYHNPICYAIAPPPILSSEVQDKGVGYVFSFVNEDDIVPRLSKDGMEDVIRLVRYWMENNKQILGKCYRRHSWFRKSESSSLLPKSNDNVNLVNMVLPGSVFYLHPYLDRYTEYENKKRRIGNVRVTLAITT